jgi:hypothetical protein
LRSRYCPTQDLLNAILGDLKQVLAVESRPCMRGNIDRAQRLPACRIEGLQCVSGSKPDLLTVKRDAMHMVDPWKGSILTDDLGDSGGCFRHVSSLVNRQKCGE